MEYSFRNKVSGAVVTAPCKLIGKDWEPIDSMEKKAEEKPKKTKKPSQK